MGQCGKHRSQHSSSFKHFTKLFQRVPSTIMASSRWNESVLKLSFRSGLRCRDKNIMFQLAHDFAICLNNLLQKYPTALVPQPPVLNSCSCPTPSSAQILLGIIMLLLWGGQSRPAQQSLDCWTCKPRQWGGGDTTARTLDRTGPGHCQTTTAACMNIGTTALCMGYRCGSHWSRSGHPLH